MFKVEKEFDFANKHESLVIGLFDKPTKFSEKLADLDKFFEGQLTELEKSGDISAKKKAISVIHTFGKTGAKRLIFVGLGNETNFSFEFLRQAFGRTFKKIKDAKLRETAIFLDSFTAETVELQDAAHAVSEAIALSTYQFEGYKQKSNEPEVNLETITVYANAADEDEIRASLMVGYAYGKGTNSARTLVNTPGNKLTATDMANYAKELAAKYNFEVEILEKEDMIKLGMGALLAVNQGSAEPPKLIVLKYQGKDEWKDVIGLVGKGITFDTGGYSLKPKDGIVGMKTDMGGAAAVLGAMEIIGELKPEKT